MMEDFFNAVSNFGFPIVLTAYLLLRFEKKLDDLKDSIAGRDGLNNTLQSLTTEIKAMRDRR